MVSNRALDSSVSKVMNALKRLSPPITTPWFSSSTISVPSANSAAILSPSFLLPGKSYGARRTPLQVRPTEGNSASEGNLRTIEKATKAFGCAWSTACRSGRARYTARWNGNSEDGLCAPTVVPSGLTRMMSPRVRVPLSIPAGVIHTIPESSRIERLPPLVVVMPRR